ncbi:hypothetical protein OH77DRAFT_1417741 [Trametes cingulata]|nr:hypothetical protein OH77DRAFT_1417741 [Trametes cingulata]
MFRRRLLGFLRSEGQYGRFGLGRIPTETSWGEGAYAATLCVRNQPIGLIAVGLLKNISIAPSLDFIVEITMLRQCDCDALAAIQHKTNSNNLEQEHFRLVHDTLIASCSSSITAFREAYVTRQPRDFKRTRVLSFLPGDVVVVEVAVKRQQHTNHASVNPTTTWYTEYLLSRITRFREA